MRLRPFWSYYGAKWNLAPYYPAPQHQRLIEPFAGSACYALLYPAREVILVEDYEVLVALWLYLIRVSEREILALPDLHEGQTVADLQVCEEARHLIGFNLRKGQTRPGLTPSAWMRRHRWKGFWGAPHRARIARQLAAIRHWRVIAGDYTAAPDGPATRFVDPPYQKRIDYSALGAWCRSQPGQLIACEAQGADWLPFEPLRTTRAISRTVGVKRSQEVVWTNAGGVQTSLPLWRGAA